MPSVKEPPAELDLAAHGSPSSKFGIPAEELVRVLGATPHQICGLHLHVGSQMDNVQAFTRSVGLLHETLAELQQKTPQRIRYLDLGGGLSPQPGSRRKGAPGAVLPGPGHARRVADIIF